MDIQSVIAELRIWQQQIDEAILAIERMDGVKRRGRPRKSRVFPDKAINGERLSRVTGVVKTSAAS